MSAEYIDGHMAGMWRLHHPDEAMSDDFKGLVDQMRAILVQEAETHERKVEISLQLRECWERGSRR